MHSMNALATLTLATLTLRRPGGEMTYLGVFSIETSTLPNPDPDPNPNLNLLSEEVFITRMMSDE